MAQRIEVLKTKSVNLMNCINHLREALVWARSYNDVQFEGFSINASLIESIEETRRLVILQYTDVTNLVLQEFQVDSSIRLDPPQSELDLELMEAFSNFLFLGVVGGQGSGGGSGNGVVPGREGGSTGFGGWVMARLRSGLGSALADVIAILCVDAVAKNFGFLLGD